MRTWHIVSLGLWVFLLSCSVAEAQLGREDFRFSIDTDVISVAHVVLDPDGPNNDAQTTVFGIGANQLGGSRVTAPASPLGLGFGWAVNRKLLLGVRLGLGFDVLSPDAGDQKRKVLALSLMPGITFVPLGRKAKLFLQASPLLQVNREKQGDLLYRWLLGGFSTGVGTMIFVGSAVSADLGFFLEGRFGRAKVENTNFSWDGAHVSDIRGIVRLGLSLWR